MKPILLLALLLVGVLVFSLVKKDTSSPGAAAPGATPPPQPAVWTQAIPDGTELLPEGAAKLHVRPVRRNEGQKVILDFEITEEHGYMVDGITVVFWYQPKNPPPAGVDAAAGVESARISHFVPERLNFADTLVTSTVLLDVEFEELKIDLGTTTTDDWAAECTGYNRAMRRK